MIAHAGQAGTAALGWTFAPSVVVALLVGLVLFFRAFRRLRRRGRSDVAGWSRAVLFVGAIVIAFLAVASPLHAAGEAYLLSAHMLQHVVIGDLVPVLVLLALRGPLFFHAIPIVFARGTPRKVLDTLLRPSVAFAVWGVNLALWHVPFVYELAARNAPLHAVQHSAFVVTGFLVWSQLVDPARRRRLTPQRSVAYACGLFVVGQALVNTLILSYRPLYPLYADQPVRLLGLTPFEDQQAAAFTMMLEQLLTLGTFVALRIRTLLRAPLVLAHERHPFAV